MKIAILSDTHDNTQAIVWIIEYLNQQKINICLHAGDIINPGILFRFRDHYQGTLHFVFGNNDGEHAIWERRSSEAKNVTCHLNEMRIELNGRKIFMNHFSSIGESVVKSGDFDLVIGGHDHRYRVIEKNSSLFMNPGNTVTKDKWLPQSQLPQDKESGFVVIDLKTMKFERIMLPDQFQA